MRKQGVVGYIMTDEQITGPFDSYALFVREDGLTLMVHSEGVAYEVRDDKPWKWSDYRDNIPSYGPQELHLIAMREQATLVDLAEWVRTFGARLENNFHLIYSRMTEVTA